MDRLVVIGSTNVDLFAGVPRHPSPGETLIGWGGERSAGGKGANQALAAALQGASVRFVGAVGDDMDADIALAGLLDAGVELGAVRRVSDTPTGLAIITVSDDGENAIVVIPGANAAVRPAHAEEAVAAMGDADVLLMQGELPRKTVEAAVRAATARSRRVILNIAPWMAVARDVLVTADPLVLNQHEAVQAVAELGLDVEDDRAESLAQALHAAGTASVVITLGSDGAVVSNGEGATRVPSPQVQAVDTTGAGDAFTGALAARLLRGDSLRQAVEHAVRVGAYAVQHPGAQRSYPRRDEDLPLA